MFGVWQSVEKDVQKALVDYKLAMDKRDSYARLSYAWYLQNGMVEGMKEDGPVQAAKIYQLLVEQNNSYGQGYFAECLLYNWSVD
jgi:TPR repeat protein